LVQQHRRARHQTQHGAAFPPPADQADHQTYRQTIQQTENNFFHQCASAIAGGKLAERHVADDDGERLHPGIATLACNNGKENCQCHPLRDGVLE